jgi:hypothetical protein
MNDLVISNISVTVGSGLYSLNDLHRASGEAAKHKPANWLALQQTEDLIRELVDAGNPASKENQTFTRDNIIRVVRGGSGQQGTFVCKELVYAYAMWISPAFHLQVIRAFDAMAAGSAFHPADISVHTKNFGALVDMLTGIGIDRNAAIIGANGAVVKLAGINLLQLTGQEKLVSETQKDWFIPTELGKMLEPNMKPAEVNIHLAANGLQLKNPATNRWELTEAGHNYGRLVELTPAHGGKMRTQILWASDVLPIIKRSVKSLAQGS